MRAQMALRVGLVVVAFGLVGVGRGLAYPRKGEAAPSLAGLKLLQGPAETPVSWGSLKGKVVVLEFWATWCSPCVASLPHINQMVETLDPAKFQFLSIDDEDAAVVRAFLGKKKMAGWVGVDANGGVFGRYGVEARPTTFIVGGDGKIVAVTDIDSVSADDLRAVAAGKSVAFNPAMEITSGAVPAGAGAGRALFAVSVSQAAAHATMSIAKHPPTGTDLLGEDADSLLSDVFHVFGERYVLKDSLPEGRYDLRVNTADASPAEADLAIQQAVLAALHLQVREKTVTRPAYVLRDAGDGKKLLSPSASARGVKRGTWHDRYLLMNGTMDDLAYILATGLETPVVNETGIVGAFDARFQAAGADVASLNAALKGMGLELVAGGKEMSITVKEVSRQDMAKAAAQK